MSEDKKMEGESNVPISSGSDANDTAPEEAKTLDQIEKEKEESNKVKNLISAVILLAGIAAGSIFVDVVQFVTGSGYSEKALKTAELFEGGGKTWVAFTDPKVTVKVLTVSDDELKSCPKCDPSEVLVWLKRFVPTMTAQKVEASSEEGKQMIADYKLKTVPAFVFEKKVEDTSFFTSEARVLFEDMSNNYVLNATQLGVPVGKYLTIPAVTEADPIIGNKDAKVKVVVFSDFQCPYCKMFYSTVTKVAKEYGDKVALTYKEFPLDFHPQAMNSSMAALCAQEQGKYWEMAEVLYGSQDTWGNTEGKGAFKKFALSLRLNAKQFDECIDSDKYKDKLTADAAVATEYGLGGTPSGFVGTQFIGGVLKEEDLKKMIDEELAKS